MNERESKPLYAREVRNSQLQEETLFAWARSAVKRNGKRTVRHGLRARRGTDRARPMAACSSDPVPILTRPRSAGGCATARSWGSSLSPARCRIAETRVEQEWEVWREVRREVWREGGSSGRSALFSPPMDQSPTCTAIEAVKARAWPAGTRRFYRMGPRYKGGWKQTCARVRLR